MADVKPLKIGVRTRVFGVGDTVPIDNGGTGNTNGLAASATILATARNIDGVSFNGGADITVISTATHASTSKATPVDDDEIALVNSSASNALAKLTWLNLKTTLKTYTDTLYATISQAFYVGTTSIALNRASAVQGLAGINNVTGGSSASQVLTLQSTSGVGTSDSIRFLVGDNGGTTAGTISTSGNFGIGAVPSATADLYLRGRGAAAPPATSGTTQSTGHIARFSSISDVAIDFGGYGTADGYHAWMQVVDVNSLTSSAYKLVLNPNGGDVKVGHDLHIGGNLVFDSSAAKLGVGTASPVTRAHFKTATSAAPATSGSVQSTGHVTRFDGSVGSALDVVSCNSSMSYGYALQVSDPATLSAHYPLLLQPNGGAVIINVPGTQISSGAPVGGNIVMGLQVGGDIVTGTTALATSDTTGFIYLSSCPGIPTGAASVPYTNAVPIVSDTTNSTLNINVGATWLPILTSGYRNAIASISVGSSPYVYTNTGKVTKQILITGGTVTNIEVSRDSGSTYYTVFPTSVISISPGDKLRVTYTSAPTMKDMDL